MKPAPASRRFPTSLLHWLPAISLAAAIFLLSGTPAERVDAALLAIKEIVRALFSGTPGAPAGAGLLIDWLKLGHAVGYFLLGLAVLYALPARGRWSAGAALVLCSFYALTDEFHQTFIPGRSGSHRDVILDTYAALGGVVLMLGWRLWQRASVSK